VLTRHRIVPVVLAAAALLAPAPAALAGTASPTPSPSASAGPPEASDGPRVTFGLGPSTKGKLDRRSSYNLLAARGGVITDEVAVINLSTIPLTLNLYAADAVNGTDGSLGIQPSSAEPTGSATWVTLKTPTGQGYVVVPPRSRVYVPFTVRIPADAEVGDHLAGIVASTVAAGQAPGDRATDVELEQRLALRLGTRVAGQLAPGLTVENVSASYAGSLNPFGAGSATVTYTVRNTGNVRLAGTQEVRVDGGFGFTAASTPLEDLPLLLPGGSATLTVPVEGVQALGLMSAVVTVVPLGAAGDANTEAEPATGRTSFWAMPWLLVALLLAVVVLLGWWWRRRRALRDELRAAAPRTERDLVGT
jgi:hypothetical protein